MAKKRGGKLTPHKVKTADYIINQHGVKITTDEARQLRNIVARVNRKANKMEDEYKGTPLFYGSRQLDENREQLRLMGEEMDIMIRKRSAALGDFKTKKAFNAYMRSAQRAMKTDYLAERGKQYKANLITAIKNNYGEFPDLVKGVVMKIQMMPQKDFQNLVGMNRAFQIKYQYKLSERLAHLMALRDSLGLRSDLDDYDYDYDY